MSKIGFDFTFENIEKLADIINEKELSEITIESDDAKICIKGKKCPPPMPPMPMAMPAPVASEAPKADAPKAVSGNVVKSPIVGTFYSAPAPDKAPFVTVGQQVNKGDVLFIIESMKVMSEVQSEFSGVVKEILVNNADPLEFDQPVMVIG